MNKLGPNIKYCLRFYLNCFSHLTTALARSQIFILVENLQEIFTKIPKPFYIKVFFTNMQ